MARNNGTEKPKEVHPQTSGKLKDYRCELSDKIKNAASITKMKQSSFDMCAISTSDAEVCYDYIKKGFEKYKDLSLDASTKIANDSEEIYKMICLCKDEVKTSIDTKIGNSVKALRKLGSSIKAVNEAFCKLENEISDNCNAQQLNILRQEITGTCSLIISDGDGMKTSKTKSRKLKASKENKTAFDDWIDKTCDNVKDAAFNVNELLNMAVGVASVNALVDFTNLKEVGEQLKNQAAELNDDIGNNITFTREQTLEACTGYTEAIESLSTKTYEERKASLQNKALYKVCNFLENDCTTTLTWEDLKDRINNLVCGKVKIPDSNDSDDDTTSVDAMSPKEGKDM